MDSKFPVTTTLLKVQDVLTTIVGIIGGAMGLYAMAELSAFIGIIIIAATAVIVIFNLFLSELLKIFLHIEKNTRKD
jgi:hypothetical protein